MKQKNTNTSYLDVSQFILKEHSPLFKPRSVDQPSEINHSQYELSPIASPIFDTRINFSMTPLFERGRLDPFKQANLDQLDSFTLDASIIDHKNKRVKRNRPRLPSSYHIVQNQLQDIIEEHDSYEHDDKYSNGSQQNSNSQQESHILQDNEQMSEYEGQQHQKQNQKQSNLLLEISNYEFKCPEWQCQNPKKQLINSLKAAINKIDLQSEQAKIDYIKNTFQKYLCQYQKFYFEECFSVLLKQKKSPSQLIQVLIKGIEQTFRRQIHGLSFQKRRVKLLRYLDKKKRRVWRKKVSYDCRKKVADGRLRIKGKFVTYQQACEQLGLASIQGYTPDQIKQMLYKKLQQS